MTPEIKTIGIIGAGQMGTGIAQVVRARRLSTCVLNDLSDEPINAGARHHRRPPGPPGVASGAITEADSAGGARAHQARADRSSTSPAATSSSRRPPRTRRSSARSSQNFARSLRPETIVATNTSSISITRLAAVDRPAGAVHRHPLHEPGAGDAARRADPRHRHRGCDLRGSEGLRRQARQDIDRWRRISRPSSSTASCCR